jgi:uncharacterized phiE125 gp8 family phage protein
MYLKRKEEIGAEPVTLEQAKSQLDIIDSFHDALIGVYITAARRNAENYINQAIVKTRYEQSADRLPLSFELLKYPVTAVESVAWGEYNYTDADYQVRDNYLYLPVVDGLEPAFDMAKVTYIAGYEDGGVPEDIISAILLIIKQLYDNEEKMPEAAKSLLNYYRILNV